MGRHRLPNSILKNAYVLTFTHYNHMMVSTKVNRKCMIIVGATEEFIKRAKENNGTVTTTMVELDTRVTMDRDATIKGMLVLGRGGQIHGNSNCSAWK